MSTASLSPPVVVIGGSAGIGLETARLARAEGAKLVLAARNLERLQHAGSEIAALRTVAFNATDFERLAQFFAELPTTIDHVLVTGPGPCYAPLAEFDFEKAREDLAPEHGGPARLRVPHLYLWKSAKWVRGISLPDYHVSSGAATKSL